MNSPPSVPQAQGYTKERILLSSLPALVHPGHPIVPQGWTDPIHNTLTLNSHLQRRSMKKKLHFLEWPLRFNEMHILPYAQILCPYLAPIDHGPTLLGHCRSRERALFSAKTKPVIIAAAKRSFFPRCLVCAASYINVMETARNPWLRGGDRNDKRGR